jgi:hypothetical protein
MSTAKPVKPVPLKPIVLYDHLPGILAGYPALMFFVMAGLQWAAQRESKWWPEALDGHLLFWIALSLMVVWYVAYHFNLPKSKFFLAFGLLGTFVGIPIVLELTGYISPFQFMAKKLGKLAPEINSGAWIVLAIVFSIIWLLNLIWSRTHMRVRIDESGLTVSRLGGKGERFELVGLKTENEPLDYLELFIAGIGSLSLKTRMNKPIFTMKRVIGLYRTPWFPFFRGKLARIEALMNYHGQFAPADRTEMAEAADAAEMEENARVDADDLHGETDVDAVPTNSHTEVDTPDKPEIQ